MPISLRQLAVAALALDCGAGWLPRNARWPPPGDRCGQQRAPLAQPPPDRPRRALHRACFEPRGTRRSSNRRPTSITSSKVQRAVADQWVLYDSSSEKNDPGRLPPPVEHHFLDNLWIDVSDYKFPTGRSARYQHYNMRSAQRVKMSTMSGRRRSRSRRSTRS